MQLREGMASWVVVLRDMKEAVGHSTAEQKTADHSHRDKERKLVAVDPDVGICSSCNHIE